MTSKPVPHIADSFLQQAELAENLLEYDKAIKYYETALAILEVANSATHPQLLSLIIRLLELHRRTGDFQSMVPLLERAKLIAENSTVHDLAGSPVAIPFKRRNRR